MNRTKRGWIVVVLVFMLVVVFLFAASTSNAADSTSSPSNKYQIVMWYDDCGDADNCDTFAGRPWITAWYKFITTSQVGESTTCGDSESEDFENPGNVLSDANTFVKTHNGNTKLSGCYISLVEDDDDSLQDDCGWGVYKIGSVLGATPQRSLSLIGHQMLFAWDNRQGEKVEQNNDIESKEEPTVLFKKKSLIVYKNELLCNNDQLWEECNRINFHQSINANNEDFTCLQDDQGNFVWVSDTFKNTNTSLVNEWRQLPPWETASILVEEQDACEAAPSNLHSIDRLGIIEKYGPLNFDCLPDFPVAIEKAARPSTGQGCVIGIGEMDDGLSDVSDDCGIGFYKYGTRIGNGFVDSRAGSGDLMDTGSFNAGNNVFLWEELEKDTGDLYKDGGWNLKDWPSQGVEGGIADTESAAACFDKEKLTADSAYICNTNNRWYRCDAAVEGNAIVIPSATAPAAGTPETTPSAEDRTFVCLQDNNGFFDWYDYTNALPYNLDYDEDKVPNKFDCAPNEIVPEGQHGKIHGQFPRNCDPSITDSNSERFCIVKKAPEICGDSINNDCNGFVKGDATDVASWSDVDAGGSPISLREGQNNISYWLAAVGELKDSSDICDNNYFACSGKAAKKDPDNGNIVEDIAPIAVGSCVEDGNRCSWVHNSAGTDNGNNCCGDNPSNDLGAIADVTTHEAISGEPLLSQPGQYLCLKRSNESDQQPLVGFQEKPQSWTSGEGGNCPSESGWCWLPAFGEDKFKVFTINPQTEDSISYDVVSNGNIWQECRLSDSSVLQFSLDLPENSLDWSKSNRFLCYKEAEHFSWAECGWGKDDGSTDKINLGLKGRFAGEGEFILPLSSADLSSADATPTQVSELFASADSSGVVDIDTSLYEKFYGKDFSYDFTGYDTLNFLVKFCADATCTTSTPLADMHLPMQFQVQMFLKGLPDTPVFSRSVLADAVNPPLADGKNGYLFIQVPLAAVEEAPAEAEVNNLQSIGKIRFQSFPSGSPNLFKIRNVYLTKSGGDAGAQKTQLLCSGQNAQGHYAPAGDISSLRFSAWLQDYDAGDPNVGVTGEYLCKNVYGENAWLGNDVQVDSTAASANCCGNSKDEYYVGASANKFACWNSQPVEPSKTSMNVEVGIGEYHETEYHWDEEPTMYSVEATAHVSNLMFPVDNKDDGIIHFYDAEGELVFGYDGHLKIVKGYALQNDESYSDMTIRNNKIFDNNNIIFNFIQPTLSSPSILDNSHSGRGSESDTSPLISTDNTQYPKTEIDYLLRSEPSLSLSYDPTKVYKITNKLLPQFGKEMNKLDNTPRNLLAGRIIKETFSLSKENLKKESTIIGDITIVSSIPDEVKVSFLDVDTGEELQTITRDSLSTSRNFQIIAEPAEGFTIEPTIEEKTITDKSFSFPCNQEQCLFPLPGKPPYKITNPHPELYDLYFVTGAGEEKQIKIIQDAQPFNEDGNILAKRVAQQVLYVNELNTLGDEEISFYSCMAPNAIVTPPTTTAAGAAATFTGVVPLTSCAVKDNFYCSPSQSKNGATTINTWLNTVEQKQVGYTILNEEPNPEPENLQLGLQEGVADVVDPSKRNHTSFIVPGRNLIPNAEFTERDGNDILYWELSASSTSSSVTIPPPPTDSPFPSVPLSPTSSPYSPENFIEKNRVNQETHAFQIYDGDFFRSDKIAIPQNVQMQFTQANGCAVTLHLFNKEGTTTTASAENFPTNDATFLYLEITAPCILQEPSLQVIDNDKPAAPYSYNENYPAEIFPRAGLACCSEKYCWNGYACIAPMDDNTLLAEHITTSPISAAAEMGRNYRCIDGQWVDTPRRTDWNGEQQGFCNDATQCFVISSRFAQPGITGSNPTLHDGDSRTLFHLQSGEPGLPACIDSDDYLLDNYCANGMWTSRTKFLAADMLALAEGETDKDYTLFCSDAKTALVALNDQENKLFGEQAAGTAPASGILAPATPTETSKTCFPIVNAEVERLIPQEENKCVNSICVLKNKDGKVALGTTLNRAVDASNSFVESLGINKQTCLISATKENGYTVCQKETNKNLWHDKELNAVIFSKELTSLRGSLLDRFLSFFDEFLGRKEKPSVAAQFTLDAENYRDIYLLKKGSKKVRAVLETLPGGAKTILAEYEQFTLPLCSYVDKSRLPESFTGEIFPGFPSPVSCTKEGNLQRAELVLPAKNKKDILSLWPQLTGRLRVE